MKIGIISNVLQDRPLKEALEIFKSFGIQAIEPGSGGVAGKAHINPAELLADEAKLAALKETLESSGVKISVLSCHGNPIHPDKAQAESDDRDMREAVLLAERLGIDTISCFSGCAGDCPESKYPNWVTCSWP
ncbi:MAG: sugar phosphate isomerase/epimerase, partial [Oscillospiraceae bacterium]|nr:sugar phosphate isomerase/epimerase [Oscillospiraceae bacterium]